VLPGPDRAMRAYVIALVLGVVAVVVATALGTAGSILETIAAPPTVVRAALVGGSTVVAIALLGRAVAALGAGDAPDRDMATMIRGVRLAFLAVAALVAGAGWFLGQPLLLVVALVVAGVDVVETTFLLIVARSHRDGSPGG
jgi:hypothetical protein